MAKALRNCGPPLRRRAHQSAVPSGQTISRAGGVAGTEAGSRSSGDGSPHREKGGVDRSLFLGNLINNPILVAIAADPVKIEMATQQHRTHRKGIVGQIYYDFQRIQADAVIQPVEFALGRRQHDDLPPDIHIVSVPSLVERPSIFLSEGAAWQSRHPRHLR